MKTIVVQLAGVHDMELPRSVISAFESAEHPNRVYVTAVFQSHDESLCQSQVDQILEILDAKNLKDNFKYKIIKLIKNIDIPESELSSIPLENLTWVGKGRHEAMKLADGQDYGLQLDGHSYFGPRWDSILIELYETAKLWHGPGKFVISGYPPGYTRISEDKVVTEDTGLSRLKWSSVSGWQGFLGADGFNERTRTGVLKFMYAQRIGAGFVLGGADFARDTGIDPLSVWADDDLFQSSNLYSRGYSFIFPANFDPKVYHLYARSINEFAGKREEFTIYWGDSARLIARVHDLLKTYVRSEDRSSAFKNYCDFSGLEVYDDGSTSPVIKKAEKLPEATKNIHYGSE